MSITTTAAAGTLEAFAAGLAGVGAARPSADRFLGAITHVLGDTVAPPVRLRHADILGNRELREAWEGMHDTLRGALAHTEAPAFGTAGVTDAKLLVGRLEDAERTMASIEANPTALHDVSGVAYSVRTRVDDILGRGREGVLADARLLRSIDGA